MRISAHRQPSLLRSRPASRIPTVCVVDPQADDYQGWDSLVQSEGAKLQIIGSAEEALRLARTHAIDLWVVNTELPGLSGFELCAILKSQSASAPVWLVANEYTAEAEHRAWSSRATLFCCVAALDEHLAAVAALQHDAAHRSTL